MVRSVEVLISVEVDYRPLGAGSSMQLLVFSESLLDLLNLVHDVHVLVGLRERGEANGRAGITAEAARIDAMIEAAQSRMDVHGDATVHRRRTQDVGWLLRCGVNAQDLAVGGTVH